MASINDVFNRLGVVNDTLSWIYKATTQVQAGVTTLDGDVKAGTTATVNAITTLDGDVNSGFASTLAALKALATIEIAAVDLLYHLTQQADTMICELGQISQNTCGILTQITIQTDLQQDMRKDIGMILDIQQAAHPEVSLQIHRLAELRAKIDECCPPTPPEPACTYQPCPAPKSIGAPKMPVVGQSGPPTNLK